MSDEYPKWLVQQVFGLFFLGILTAIGVFLRIKFPPQPYKKAFRDCQLEIRRLAQVFTSPAECAQLVAQQDRELAQFLQSSYETQSETLAAERNRPRSYLNEQLYSREHDAVLGGREPDWTGVDPVWLQLYHKHKEENPPLMLSLEEARRHSERLRLDAIEQKRRQAEEQEAAKHAQIEQKRRQAEEQEAARHARNAWEESERCRKAAIQEAERHARLVYERAYKVRQCGACNFYPAFLIPKCPFCSSNYEQVEIAAIDRSIPLPQSVPITPVIDGPAMRTLLQAVNARLEAHDFIGIANSMLEVLMRKGQEENPDDEARVLYQTAPRIAAGFFQMPEILSYAQPHRDIHLPHHLRYDWLAYAFPQLVIFAYMLGATWNTLPPPHDQLLPYYLFMAEKQAKSIQEAKEAYEKRPKPDPIAAILRNSDVDAESKLRAIAARTMTSHGQSPAAGPYNPEHL